MSTLQSQQTNITFGNCNADEEKHTNSKTSADVPSPIFRRIFAGAEKQLMIRSGFHARGDAAGLSIVSDAQFNNKLWAFAASII
jgi:hypothetical protein